MRSLMYSGADTLIWHDLHVPDLDDREDGPSSGEHCDPLNTTPPAYRLSDHSRTSAASWLPALWGVSGHCTDDAQRALSQPHADSAVRAMLQSGLVSDAGLLHTTLQRSGQQWDAPNCWPPLLCMWVDGLLRWRTPASRALANKLGSGYLRAVQRGLQESGCAWEKYDADGSGRGGCGGEYGVQVGFGWSNGVALHLMVAHGMTL